MLTILFNQYGYVRGQSTGGGGAASSAISGGAWYHRKYRNEIRREIESAVKSLRTVKDRRKHKRILKKAVERIAPVISFDIEVTLDAVLVPLDAIRSQVQILAKAISVEGDRAQSIRLGSLLQDYTTSIRKLETQEEEAVAAILLLAA